MDERGTLNGQLFGDEVGSAKTLGRTQRSRWQWSAMEFIKNNMGARRVCV